MRSRSLFAPLGILRGATVRQASFHRGHITPRMQGRDAREDMPHTPTSPTRSQSRNTVPVTKQGPPTSNHRSTSNTFSKARARLRTRFKIRSPPTLHALFPNAPVNCNYAFLRMRAVSRGTRLLGIVTGFARSARRNAGCFIGFARLISFGRTDTTALGVRRVMSSHFLFFRRTRQMQMEDAAV